MGNLTVPTFARTLAQKSLSETFCISSQPGMHCLSTTGSLSAFHTSCWGAWISLSPCIFMTWFRSLLGLQGSVCNLAPLCHKAITMVDEAAFGNGLTDPGHQLLIIGEIGDGQEHHAEDLAGLDQMVEIGSRKVRGGGACACLVERPRIVGMPGIAEIEPAEAGEGLAVPARARRHHAVEHVDAARHRLDDVERRADAHEIAGPLLRQQRRGDIDGGEHLRLGLPDRKPANGIAVEIQGGEASCRLAA